MIGDRIKKARMALGYSAEQVAAFLGVSPATVYRYENGDISKLPSKFIRPLADYLCVHPGYLMGWDDDYDDEKHEYTPAVTSEARIISGGIDRMPKDKREQALRVLRAAFAEYSRLFEEENNDDA